MVPQEGIVDYKAVMEKMKSFIIAKGGEFHFNTRIDHAIQKGDTVILTNGIGEWEVDKVISCAGIYSDKVYQWLTHQKSPIKIVPFRGEYMELKPEAKELVNHLIYPVPDAKYPFLGVHFTRMINGSREVGPNAVFATKREGYTNKDFSLKDTFESLTYKGMMKFLQQNFAFSMGEFYTSINPKAFLAKAQKMIPDIRSKDLVKGTAGVRAQAIGEDGKLQMDFNIMKDGNHIHILNAPSPGATASLAIAGYVIDEYILA